MSLQLTFIPTQPPTPFIALRRSFLLNDWDDHHAAPVSNAQ